MLTPNQHAASRVVSATSPLRTSKLRTPGHRPRTVKGANDHIDARFSCSANRRHVRVANHVNAAVERNLSCAPSSTLRQALHTA